jgi:hypothetical protein
LLKHADPNLAAYAKTIAQEVLTHPIISDSVLTDWKVGQYWQIASAISKDELIQILRTLAKQTGSTDGGPQPEPWAIALANSLDQLNSSVADKLLQLSPVLKQAIPPEVANADYIISQLAGSAEQLTGAINQCFDTMMDRVSQQFTMHTRMFTVLFSMLIAFALHLDAFKLLTQLSSDSELRARLVTSADVITKKADEMKLTSTNEPPVTYAAAINQLTNAASDFQSILEDRLKLQLLPDPYPSISTYWKPSWTHFWGTLASAALLSLGAPFWFNILKTLSSLQPVLAKKKQDEPAAENDK